jgi:hypothetical protein
MSAAGFLKRQVSKFRPDSLSEVCSFQPGNVVFVCSPVAAFIKAVRFAHSPIFSPLGQKDGVKNINPRSVNWLFEPVPLLDSSSRQIAGFFHFTNMGHERRVTRAFNFVELPASLNFSGDIRL